jgi:hypothetical protein
VKQLVNHEASKTESKSAHRFFSSTLGKKVCTFWQSLVCPNSSNNTDSSEKKRNTQALFLLLQRKHQFRLFSSANQHMIQVPRDHNVCTKFHHDNVFEELNKSDKMWIQEKISINIPDKLDCDSSLLGKHVRYLCL